MADQDYGIYLCTCQLYEFPTVQKQASTSYYVLTCLKVLRIYSVTVLFFTGSIYSLCKYNLAGFSIYSSQITNEQQENIYSLNDVFFQVLCATCVFITVITLILAKHEYLCTVVGVITCSHHCHNISQIPNS